MLLIDVVHYQEMPELPVYRGTFTLRIGSIKYVSRFYMCKLVKSSSTVPCLDFAMHCSRPYIAAELPSNLLLRKIGPKLLMPTLLTSWGIIVTLQGLVSSYAGLIVVRCLLGLVEGPMFPGIVLYLSGFYTRRELSLR